MSLGMIGIGLGGFMDGFNKQQEVKDTHKRSAILDEQLKMDQKRAERQDVLNARDDAEYQRGEDTRASVARIGQDAQTKFDQGVASGQLDPNRFSDFYRTYAIPQIQNTYLAAGDVGKAADFMKWAETADAKRGGELAMSAMWKAQNGDLQGSLNDALKAGQLSGYVDHGYELVGHEPIVDKSGTSLGFRVRVKGPDGKEVQRDITNADLPRMVATWLNPQAAYESRQAAQADTAKREQGMADYKQKKDIDKQYEGGAKDRGAAIASLRKRFDGELDITTGKANPKFDEMGRDEQEKMISQEISLQQGTNGQAPAADQPGIGAAASTPRRVTVDNVTGQPLNAPVQPAAPQQQASAPPQAPAPQQAPAGGAPAAIQQQSPQQSREDNVQYMIEYANQALAQKVDPLKIAEELQVQGIPRNMWPEQVQAAAAQAASKQPGLAR